MLGRVEDIDGEVAMDYLGKYLRVRINLDINQPLKCARHFVREKKLRIHYFEISL